MTPETLAALAPTVLTLQHAERLRLWCARYTAPTPAQLAATLGPEHLHRYCAVYMHAEAVRLETIVRLDKVIATLSAQLVYRATVPTWREWS